ncbi:MAG: calcium-binding protein [Acidimicrobiia bacterium]|nr:calcium-binding protein [Acidimicrobiia bacterium]
MAARKHRMLRLLTVMWMLGSLLAIPSTSALAAATCGGETVTIAGTSGADTLTGTPGRDVILGKAGNDTINGNGGNDIICAGDGADVVRGGAGKDTVIAGDGDDTVYGGAGNDTLYGGSGKDIVFGGAGRDSVIGGNGADRLYGGNGQDVIDGGNGADKAWGGAAFDDCYSATRKDPCEGPVFLETFDGDPSSPANFASTPDITVSTNSRVGSTRDKLAAMQADHGSNCAGPPSKHTVDDYEEAQFRCRNHMMTAISSGPDPLDNYAVSMFSPNAILDFSAGEAVIQFDVSTLRRSKRDWFDIWITPWKDLQRIPVQERPSMQGPPKNGILIALKSFTDTGSFDVEVHKNFNESQIDGPVEWIGYEDFLEPSPTVRSTFEIRLTKNHVVVGMPYEPFYWISEPIPGGLPFDKGVVQFGHNSYDVFDCDGCSVGPNTWHWDNIYLAPAEPFTALAANRRHVDNSSASFVTFADPAPKNAAIQFTGIGFDLEVSFNGGATWKPAVTQHNREIHHWRWKNYHMPVPQGTTRVDFRGTNPYDGHWQIQDISVISRNVPAGAYSLDQTSAELAVELTPVGQIGCVNCALDQQLPNLGAQIRAAAAGTTVAHQLICDIPAADPGAATDPPGDVDVVAFRLRGPTV